MNVGKHLLAATLVVVLGYFLLTAFLPTSSLDEKPAAPHTVAEAISNIEKRGLCWCSDRADGLIANRVLVTETPLSWQAVNEFPLHRRIEGAVWVYRLSNGLLVPADQTLVWGSFVIWGDPRLIQRLTGPADGMTAK